MKDLTNATITFKVKANLRLLTIAAEYLEEKTFTGELDEMPKTWDELFNVILEDLEKGTKLAGHYPKEMFEREFDDCLSIMLKFGLLNEKNLSVMGFPKKEGGEKK